MQRLIHPAAASRNGAYFQGRALTRPADLPAVPHADAVGATQDENEVTWNAALHTG